MERGRVARNTSLHFFWRAPPCCLFTGSVGDVGGVGRVWVRAVRALCYTGSSRGVK